MNGKRLGNERREFRKLLQRAQGMGVRKGSMGMTVKGINGQNSRDERKESKGLIERVPGMNRKSSRDDRKGSGRKRISPEGGWNGSER
jgi:hypothetical protein